MICKCGDILDVIKVHEPPKHLNKQEKMVYKRTCDVQCLVCGKIYYSQPYDFGKTMNVVRNISNDQQ